MLAFIHVATNCYFMVILSHCYSYIRGWTSYSQFFYNPWNATTYTLLSQQVNDGGCLAGIISICTYDTCMSMCCFSQRPGNLLPTPGVVDIVQ